MIFKIVICLSPVFLLLILLLFLDSLKLVNMSILLICLGWGILSAALSFYSNTFLIRNLALNFDFYSDYIAPVVEEMLKPKRYWLMLEKEARNASPVPV